nr:hypothetical protein [Tanacetum cinerariifolium]
MIVEKSGSLPLPCLPTRSPVPPPHDSATGQPALWVLTLGGIISTRENMGNVSDANKYIYLVNVHDDEDMFGVNDLDSDEVIVESVHVVEKAKEVVNDITLAKALMEIKSAQLKADKVVIQEPEQVSSQQPSQVKDKGKGKMVKQEPVNKLSKKDQLMLDEEVAFKLQAEEEEEERIAKEKAQQIKEKVEDDKESEELKKCLEIILDDEDDVTIDATPLSSKSPTIIHYKIYKEGEYELWRMRMEQYIQIVDYSLWEVIENELKARSTLLMGIPNEHQLKFNFIKDAKSLQQAVEKRFGGNAATKKTQRNLLKQKYENFTASSSEVLDLTFDRLQKLISQLEIHGKSISQEDVNQKFLRSLSPEWNTHTSVWRNKPEIDTLSLDDLYNNLKIYEPEMAMLTMRAKRFLKNIRRKFSMNGNETIGFDKSKVDCYNCHKRGHFAKEYRAPRSQDTKHKESTKRIVPMETPTSAALVSCDGLGGYDWSDQAEDGLGYNVVPPLYTGNFFPLKPDLSGLEEFVNEPIVSEPTVKKPIVETSEAKASADKPKVIRKNFGPPLIEDWMSDSEDKAESNSKIEKETVKPSFAKIKQFQNHKMVKPVWNYNQRVNHKIFAKKTHPHAKRNMVPRAVLMKSRLPTVNTARLVSAAHPKSTVNVARPMSYLLKLAHSSIKRPFDKKTAFTNSNVPQKVNTVRSKIVNAARPKAVVNAARPKAVVNAILGNKVNAVKASAYWVWKLKTKVINHVSKHNNVSITLKKFDYIDAQRRSKDMSCLTDYEEIDGGYVTFGGNLKGGKIIGRVPIKNNMYSIDLKNIVPKGDLTCLFAKATSDESKL